jgi:hypothetical protein
VYGNETSIEDRGAKGIAHSWNGRPEDNRCPIHEAIGEDWTALAAGCAAPLEKAFASGANCSWRYPVKQANYRASSK